MSDADTMGQQAPSRCRCKWGCGRFAETGLACAACASDQCPMVHTSRPDWMDTRCTPTAVLRSWEGREIPRHVDDWLTRQAEHETTCGAVNDPRPVTP